MLSQIHAKLTCWEAGPEARLEEPVGRSGVVEDGAIYKPRRLQTLCGFVVCGVRTGQHDRNHLQPGGAALPYSQAAGQSNT